jgi:DNA-binding response OmpR family regulator
MPTAVIATPEEECRRGISTALDMCLPDMNLIFCTSVKQLIRQLQTKDVDIVVLDYSLPYSSGWNLISKARMATGASILVLSYQTSSSFITEAINLGADRCLTKPISLLEFAAVVRALIRAE